MNTSKVIIFMKAIEEYVSLPIIDKAAIYKWDWPLKYR